MINFNRSLLSAATASHITAHFFFRNVVGVSIHGIGASLNGGARLGFFSFPPSPPVSLPVGKNLRRGIPCFENLQMHIPVLFKVGVGLC